MLSIQLQHLLVCPMMDTACSPQDLATANGIAIGCSKHWEGTIWQTYDYWWKDKNDDEYNCSNHNSLGHPGRVYATKMAIRKHSNTFTLN